jgi:hypothetical protein
LSLEFLSLPENVAAKSRATISTKPAAPRSACIAATSASEIS